MISRRFAIGLLIAILTGVTYAPVSHAAGLKVAPLQYRTVLKKGEQKKGSIDISNPTRQTLTVTTSVQAFRQIDDKGRLEFYNDEALTKGVKLDLASFKLGPREALRMYFLLDGKTLPSGDVYGAIFFAFRENGPKSGVQQAVRVGSLLSVVNGTPGPREATITKLDVPFIQVGTAIKGAYNITNPADEKTNTGFYPEVTTKLWPGDISKKQSSALLFAGRTRTNLLDFKEVGFGFHKVEVSYKNSSKSAWVFVAEPFIAVVIGVVLLAVVVESGLWLRRHKKRRK